jgi:hypothetical protein
MKYFYYSFFVLCLLLTSCSEPGGCEDIVCTKEFRIITVKFVDANNNPQIVENFASINKRTGETMGSNNDIINQGLYVVANDSDLIKLSDRGDIIMVSAIHPKTNVKILLEYVVSGGICNCHVNKISGAEIVKL